MFVLAVTLTPRAAVWAFAIHSSLLLVVMAVAGIGVGLVGRRLTIEIPFLLFALLLPFVSGGETRDVFGVALAVDGLWSTWNVVVKATLCLGATILLAATTATTDILRGLERMKAPSVMVAIAGFMIRYADVVTGEMRRMALARASRGHDPRWFWQLRATAGSAGTLFVRTFERGERVYLSMISRGYRGVLPARQGRRAAVREWSSALGIALVAAVVTATTWVMG